METETIPATGDSSGSSGGGGGQSVYTVTVEEPEHGKISASPVNATGGSRITLTVEPDSGYELGTLTVTDSSGREIAVKSGSGGKYTFVMPYGRVNVKAEFTGTAGGYEDCPKDDSCPIWPFTDADTNAWYHDGVHYCLENGLMNGHGDGAFGPDSPLTRAQLVQILHNREGRPAVNYLMTFEDVPDTAWYAEAVRWAASQGVVTGYSDEKFGPDDNITREQLAAVLWRYAGSPETGRDAEFADMAEVSDYALEAVDWARANGIIQGKDGNQFDPQGLATRAETATMLMRFLSM